MQLSTVICSAREGLQDVLEETGHVEVQAVLTRPGTLPEAVRLRRPDLLFVELGEEPEMVLQLLERLPAPRPLLLLAGPQDDSRTILRAMRLGAREFLAPDATRDAVHAAVKRLLLEMGERALPTPSARAPVIAVMGAKGGVGATFAACQLAAELRRRGSRVALVDLSLRVGDVALYYDIHPRYTVADLASEHGHLDSAYLHTILEPHASGVRVLAAPRRPEDADLVGVSHVEGAVAVLRDDFDWVILDVPRSWDEPSLKALDVADQIFLVTLMDVPTLEHARQHLDLLQRLGHPLHKIRLVANRYTSASPVRNRDFQEFLGRDPDAWLPNDYPTAQACVNEGRTLADAAPRSRLRAAYKKLAGEAYGWCDVKTPTPRRAPTVRERLGRWLRRNRHAAD